MKSGVVGLISDGQAVAFFYGREAEGIGCGWNWWRKMPMATSCTWPPAIPAADRAWTDLTCIVGVAVSVKSFAHSQLCAHQNDC
jgi:hypothetical protein